MFVSMFVSMYVSEFSIHRVAHATKNYISFWYKCTFIRQCDLVLIQFDVEFIKSSKYITDWILGLIFEVGVSSSSPKEIFYEPQALQHIPKL